MAKLARYEHSQQGFQTNVDLFNLPATNSGVVNSSTQIFHPTSAYRDSQSPLNFVINSPNDYLDTSSCFIFMELVVKKTSDAGPIALVETDVIAPTNNLGSACFDSIEVLINGTSYVRPTPYISFVNHIQDLFYASRNNKPQLDLQLFIPDTIVDDFVPANTGFSARRKLCALSKKFYCIARIGDPLFVNQNRWLIPDTHLSITMRRSPVGFVLDGTDPRKGDQAGPYPYMLIIENCHLQIKKCTLNPQLVKAHQALLNSGKKACYPLKYNEIRLVPVPKSTLQYQTDLVYVGNLPKFVLLTFVENAALSGTLKNSSFTFKHFGIERVVCQVDGDLTYYKQIDLDIAGGDFLLAYKNTANLFLKYNSKYSMEDMKNGSFMLAFELNPEIKPKLLHPSYKGQLQFYLKFKTETTSAFSMMLFSEFENMLSLGKNREVISDYTIN